MPPDLQLPLRLAILGQGCTRFIDDAQLHAKGRTALAFADRAFLGIAQRVVLLQELIQGPKRAGLGHAPGVYQLHPVGVAEGGDHHCWQGGAAHHRAFQARNCAARGFQRLQ